MIENINIHKSIPLTKIVTNDQRKQKAPRENVKRYERDQKIIATREKLLMLLIIQTFSIFYTKKKLLLLSNPHNFHRYPMPYLFVFIFPQLSSIACDDKNKKKYF